MQVQEASRLLNSAASALLVVVKAPRVANLQDLSSIVEDVGSDECVGVSTNDSVAVN